MQTMTWKLLTPVSGRAPLSREKAPLRQEVRRLAFLSNRKPNASLVQREFGGRIQLPAAFYETHNAGLGAKVELLDRIAAECDAALVGSGD
jgi:hypothetical protein